MHLSSFTQAPAAVVVANTYKLAEQVPQGYTQVKIGRPSVLGNPFKLGEPYADGRPGTYQRGEAVIDHEKWFRAEMANPDSKVRAEVIKLAERVASGEKLALICYCKPLACHGDVLAKAILGYSERIKKTQ